MYTCVCARARVYGQRLLKIHKPLKTEYSVM